MILPLDIQTTLLVSSAAGLISSYLAYRRGKSPIFWFCIGVLFGFFGVFALFFSANGKKQRAVAPVVIQTFEPKPFLVGPVNKFWYYLDASHTQIGPLSYQGMTKAWQKGTLPLTALVWHEDLSQWTPLKELIQVESTQKV